MPREPEHRRNPKNADDRTADVSASPPCESRDGWRLQYRYRYQKTGRRYELNTRGELHHGRHARRMPNATQNISDRAE